MDNVIELQKLWQIVKKGFWLIITLTIVGGLVAFGISKYVIPKKYDASVSLLVNRAQDDDNSGTQFANQQADVQLISTYKNIITQPVILDKVAKNLSTNQKITVKKATKAKYVTNQDGTKRLVKKAKAARYRYVPAKYELKSKDLTDLISITNDTNSQVFEVTVKTKDPVEAKDIANEIGDVFKHKIGKLMSVKNVTIISKATVNRQAVFPNTKLLTLAGLVLGMMMAFLLLLVRELTDRSITNIDFIKEELQLNDLGTMYLVGKVQSYSNFTADSHRAGARKIKRRV